MRFLFVRPEVCHPASFRFHLAMDTLAIDYALPTAGRARDFHPLESVPYSSHKKVGANASVLQVSSRGDRI